MNSIIEKYCPVKLGDDEKTIVLLDQTLLPNKTVFLNITDVETLWEAIYSLRVRGAPAIGVAAGYGAYLAAKNSKADNYDELARDFKKSTDYLATSRPTAVNLFWAIDRMNARLKSEKGKAVPEVVAALKQEADDIRTEDEQTCMAIGEHALSLLKPNWGILTHCNAGTIATAKYGTTLAPVYLGQERGYNFKVFADETRPLLQGARLTAWELHMSGVDVTLICDNMASIVMKEGKIQACLVGCDRVAANGDTANKIGTSGVAILAKHYNIPFYVCGPLSTIDMECKSGDDIHIELREASEVISMWYKEPMAPTDVKVYNPAFDVTDHSLITGIVTEKGVAYPPFDKALEKMFT